MTNRELLENAAKAAGIAAEWHCWPSTARGCMYVKNGWVSEHDGEGYSVWNPLTDDGDAFRLMAALHRRFDVGFNLMAHWLDLMSRDDKTDHLAPLRKSLLVAAAELGKRKAVPHEGFDDFCARFDQERRGQQ